MVLIFPLDPWHELCDKGPMTPTPAKIIVGSNTHGEEAHRAGCRDIRRKGLRIIGYGSTVQEACEDAFADFLDEGSIEADKVTHLVHILPCTEGS